MSKAKKTKKKAMPIAKEPSNLEIVAKIIGGDINRFSDNSLSWINLENKNFRINICFDGNGDDFDHISISEKLYEVVDEKLITSIK